MHKYGWLRNKLVRGQRLAPHSMEVPMAEKDRHDTYEDTITVDNEAFRGYYQEDVSQSVQRTTTGEISEW